MPQAESTVPFALEAEQAVLGAMMGDPERAAPIAQATLTDMDFHRVAHRRLYWTINQIIEDGGVPDFIALTSALRQAGALKECGGPEYIAQLSAAGALQVGGATGYHVRIVADTARRRRLMDAGAEIREIALSEIPLDDALDEAERKVFAVATEEGGGESLRRLEGPEILAVIESAASGKRGVPSGFLDVDEMTFGFNPGDLVVIAGATSMGKTSFALQVACSAAEAGYPTAIFSLEMTRDELVWRMICAEGMVDASRFRRHGLAGYPDSQHRIAEASKRLRSLPLYIDDTPAVSLRHVRARCRRLKAGQGLGLVVVDHLQIMRTEGENRAQALGEITGALKALAKELRVPVVLLSQLSRFKDRADKRPQLSDLRESGAIEQDSNTVIFLYRPEYYYGPTQDGNSLVGRAEAIIAKQRNGRTGTADLFFRAECARFESASHRPPSIGVVA